MGRPSDALLQWLRAQMDARKENISSLAKKLDMNKSELRRRLVGEEPLLVDDLIRVSEALGITDELSQGGMGALPDAPEAPAPEWKAHWENQPRLLFQLAFDYGFDFMFFATASACADWGGPERVRSQYADREIPLQLDAAYHKHMNPRMTPEGVNVLLSFNDGLFDCYFRWSAIRKVVFQPYPPAAPPGKEGPPSGDTDPQKASPRGGHLRLVK
ncbi:MAG TPA: hypothetical protein PKA64_01925 [Myxococcota bacterium]|nr:hypothetical protein [Myxococcota bacterium]